MCWLILLVGGATFSCTTLKLADPLPTPAKPDPVPVCYFGEPVLGHAESSSNVTGALVLHIPYRLENSGHDRYIIQNLVAKTTLRQSDGDRNIQPEEIQGFSSAGAAPVLEGQSTQTGAFVYLLPLETIIEDAYEPKAVSAALNSSASVSANVPEINSVKPNMFECNLEAVLVNSQGKQIRIGGTLQRPLPRIYKPQVRIMDITVKRAELINTRLKVHLAIVNPNPFPLNLSRFSFELYGNGRFWADGMLADLGSIEGNEVQEKDLFLAMNFINMKRDLLDQVIALRSVQYRFHGDISIGTPFEYLPLFSYSFDRSGSSPVIE